MSGADLALVMREIAPLAGKRIARVRKTDAGVFLFKIGGSELLVQPGVRLHLTMQSLQGQDAPDGFVAFLRKNLEGKTAERIEQHGADRIVEITTRSKERLIFEMFRKGNVIFVGEGGEIIACLEREEAGGRRIARAVAYEYPKATGFELKLPEKVAFRVKSDENGEPLQYSVDAASDGMEFGSLSEALDFYHSRQKKESAGQQQARGREKKLLERLCEQEKNLKDFESGILQARREGDAISQRLEEIEGLFVEIRRLKKEGKGEGEINSRIAARKARISKAQLEIEI
jgi:predicted ribosome quality control (RQC) complex YloA/Tae2 family protein